MSAPDKCPKCGAAKSVQPRPLSTFDCGAYFFADGYTLSDHGCASRQRDALAARVKELESERDRWKAYAGRLEEAGNEMEPWVEYILGDVWKNTKESKP